MKKGCYLTIQDWMVTELHLKGNELLAYALIYGYSQDEQGCFYGSYQYVTDWLSVDKTTAVRILKKLESKGLIRKWQDKSGNVTVNRYAAIRPGKCSSNADQLQNATGGKMQPVAKYTSDQLQNATPTGGKMQPNNKYNNKQDTKARTQAREEPGGMTVAAVFDAFSRGGPGGLYDALMDFDQYRQALAKKDKKKLWTPLAAKKICASVKRLVDEAGVQDRTGYAIAMLNQSIENGWTGVFAVRNFVDKAPAVHIEQPAPDKPRKITKDTTLADLLGGVGA